jgi:hypothetical protein
MSGSCHKNSSSVPILGFATAANGMRQRAQANPLAMSVNSRNQANACVTGFGESRRLRSGMVGGVFFVIC